MLGSAPPPRDNRDEHAIRHRESTAALARQRIRTGHEHPTVVSAYRLAPTTPLAARGTRATVSLLTLTPNH